MQKNKFKSKSWIEISKDALFSNIGSFKKILFENSKIVVILVGYFGEFYRKISNLGRLLINGKYAQVIGRITINMFIVYVSHIKEIKVEDGVVITGEQKGNNISADEIADKLGTINYEVLCRINPLTPRIII